MSSVVPARVPPVTVPDVLIDDPVTVFPVTVPPVIDGAKPSGDCTAVKRASGYQAATASRCALSVQLRLYRASHACNVVNLRPGGGDGRATDLPGSGSEIWLYRRCAVEQIIKSVECSIPFAAPGVGAGSDFWFNQAKSCGCSISHSKSPSRFHRSLLL